MSYVLSLMSYLKTSYLKTCVLYTLCILILYRGGGLENTFFECAVGEPKMLIICGLGRFALAYD